MSAAAPPRLSRIEALLLLLLAVLPFLNGLPADFTYDDKLIIRDNERLEQPWKLGAIFTTHYFGGSLATGQNYRPLVLLTYGVERWLHGLRPELFRGVNIVLHAGATAALAAWLLALGLPRASSLSAAALFAVLPIHVEAVTSLVGRAETLSVLLVLAAARLWLEATEGGHLRAVPYALVLGLFLAAVFVKESAVVLPGVVLIGELVRGGRWRGVRAAFRESTPAVRGAFLGLAAPLAVLFAVRHHVLGGFLLARGAGIWELENPLVLLSPPLRALNALTISLRYAAKTFMPYGLSADHSAQALTPGAGWADGRTWAGLLVLSVAALAAWRVRRVRPLVPFGLLLFAGALFPASNVPFAVGTIYAERLAYLPSAGLLVMAVGLFSPERREVPRPGGGLPRAILLAAAVLGYGGISAARNLVWRDDRALFSDMVSKFPRSAKAHYNLAYDDGRRGDVEGQRRHLEIAVALFPRYYDAWATLGKIAWTEKRWDDAVTFYRKSVEIMPEYENGRWGLAKTLEEAGRTAEADEAWDEAVTAIPGSYPVAWHRAAFLEGEGRLDEAEAEWRRAIPLGGGSSSAHLSLARLLARRGRSGDETESWKEARRALVADPAFSDARRFLRERLGTGSRGG